MSRLTFHCNDVKRVCIQARHPRGCTLTLGDFDGVIASASGDEVVFELSFAGGNPRSVTATQIARVAEVLFAGGAV